MPWLSVWLVRPDALVNTGIPVTPLAGLSANPPPARSCTFTLWSGSVLIQVVKISPNWLMEGAPTLLALIAGCQSYELVEP